MTFLRSRPRFAKTVAQRLDRRTFGRTVGVGLLAAPFLRLLRSEPAQAASGSAKRLFIMVTGGTSLEHWLLDGSSDEELVTNSWNEGLDLIKEKCVVVDNVNAGAAAHGSYPALLATLRHWNGDSIDRVVSDHLVAEGAAGVIPSLLLGADVAGDSSDFRQNGSVSLLGNSTAAHDLVFGGFDPSASKDDAAVAAALAKKQSVLDAVRSDLNDLNAMLGTEERPKLEAHLESLRQYETRLTSDGPSGDGCQVPTVMDSADPITIAQSHMQLAHAALACDVSRVVGVQWGQHNKFNINLPSIGVTHDLHQLHHNTQNLLEELGKWEKWSSEQFANFVELLDSTPDPESGESLLDSTLVVWARSLGDAVHHSCTNMRLVFAGGPNVLRLNDAGRYVNGGGEPNRRALACIAHALGQTDPEAVDGHTPLDGVLA